MLNKKLVLVGGGNMGRSLLRGMLRAGTVAAPDVVVVEIDPARAKELTDEFGVGVVDVAADVVGGADILLLAVKPFHLAALLDSIKDRIGSEVVVISIIAGAEASFIRDRLGKNNPVVRVMPNIAATVDAAASALAGCPPASDEHLALAEEIFSSVGEVVCVEERLLDAVTGLSGSGPAFVYTIIEALCDGGVRMGLSRDVALKLATQTVLGAAKHVKESGEHPAVLRGHVTTPGGTTIAGLEALEEGGVRATVMSAVRRAAERSGELSDAARKS